MQSLCVGTIVWLTFYKRIFSYTPPKNHTNPKLQYNCYISNMWVNLSPNTNFPTYGSYASTPPTITHLSYSSTHPCAELGMICVDRDLITTWHKPSNNHNLKLKRFKSLWHCMDELINSILLLHFQSGLLMDSQQICALSNQLTTTGNIFIFHFK